MVVVKKKAEKEENEKSIAVVSFGEARACQKAFQGGETIFFDSILRGAVQFLRGVGGRVEGGSKAVPETLRCSRRR